VRLRSGGQSMTVLYASKKPMEGSDSPEFMWDIPKGTFVYSVAYLHEKQGLEQITVPEHAIVGMQ
jgi:hypothetical protein